MTANPISEVGNLRTSMRAFATDVAEEVNVAFLKRLIEENDALSTIVLCNMFESPLAQRNAEISTLLQSLGLAFHWIYKNNPDTDLQSFQNIHQTSLQRAQWSTLTEGLTEANKMEWCFRQAYASEKVKKGSQSGCQPDLELLRTHFVVNHFYNGQHKSDRKTIPIKPISSTIMRKKYLENVPCFSNETISIKLNCSIQQAIQKRKRGLCLEEAAILFDKPIGFLVRISTEVASAVDVNDWYRITGNYLLSDFISPQDDKAALAADGGDASPVADVHSLVEAMEARAKSEIEKKQ